MSEKLIARKGDKHHCPLHGEGKIITGLDDCLVEGEPVARVGDIVECPDGSKATILDNDCCLIVQGKKVARLGDKTSHEGTSIQGEITSAASTTTAEDQKAFIEFGKGKFVIGKNVHFGKKATKEEIAAKASGPDLKTLSCADIWETINKEAKEVIAIEDNVERNKKITAAYAKAYQKNRKLRWAGVASFASKEVGCNLKNMKARMDEPIQLIPHVMDSDHINKITPSMGYESYMTWVMLTEGIPRTIAEKTYYYLGKGNNAVFVDIYPVIQFYERCGLERLKACAPSRIAVDGDNKSIPETLLGAFEKLDVGDADNCAAQILDHEQTVTLQEAIYDDLQFKAMIIADQLVIKIGLGRALGAAPIKVGFSAECEGGETVMFDGWNLANQDQRMPFANKVVATFKDLEERTLGTLSKHLDRLIAAAQ